MENEALLALIEKVIKEGGTALVLNGKWLKSLPLEIGQIINLTRLDISDNRLTSLPPKIGQLKNLRHIDLGLGSYVKFCENE